MTDGQVALLLCDVALIVLAALLVGRLAHAIGQPPVIGEILVGILLGPTLFHGAISHTLLPVDIRPYITALADFGLVLFMFVIGLEFDPARLRGTGRMAATVAAGATVLSFGLGLLLALYLADHHHPVNRLGFLLFVGVSVAITAFPVLARILVDQRMNATLLGTIALSAAAVADLAAWTMLALAQAITSGAGNHWLVLLVIPIAAFLRYAVRPALGWLLTRPGIRPSGAAALVLAGLLASAAATQIVGLHFVFGAFLFGLILPREGTQAIRDQLVAGLQGATTLLLPLYFVVTGLNVDLSQVRATGLIELGLIMATAITGKFAGTFLAARVQGLPARRSAVLATLMNTRGLTELIALSVGLQMGVLDRQLYSLMVVMAVVTTAMAGPLLRWLTGPEDKNAPRLEPAHQLPVAEPPR